MTTILMILTPVLLYLVAKWVKDTVEFRKSLKSGSKVLVIKNDCRYLARVTYLGDGDHVNVVDDEGKEESIHITLIHKPE